MNGIFTTNRYVCNTQIPAFRMTIIRNCPSVSANNGIMITNDLLITAA